MSGKGIEIGEYEVRTTKKNEKILHAHKTANGRYKLIAHDDGRFEYIPVPMETSCGAGA